MPEFLAVETRRPVDEFRKRVGGMLEAVSCQRKQRFHLSDGGDPQPQNLAVSLTPAVGCERYLHGIHQGSLDDPDKGVMAGGDQVHQSPESGDGFGAWDVAG